MFPLSFQSMRFYGCFDKDIVDANFTTDRCDGNPSTRDASTVEEYRHFAIDDLRDILYICDVNPSKEGMFCFSSDNIIYETPTWLGMHCTLL